VGFGKRTDSAATVQRVEIIETHFAWILLTPSHVYKLKKALRHGSMDYRSLAQRRRGCRAEVALNRRLAADVYLGVVPLSLSRHGALRLGPGAVTVDYVVWMRRLPEERMLHILLRRRSLRPGERAALLEVLAGFFRGARRHPLGRRAYLNRLAASIRTNRQSLLRHAPALRAHINALTALQQQCLRLLAHDLADRAARVVDGHGDLRPEHVCMTRPVVVIDCIEFARDLRLQDPLEEMAFLALEIEHLGRARLAWKLLQEYRAAHDSDASDALTHLYVSLRALLRARLSAWHIGDQQFRNPRPWLRRTRVYLREAEEHARAALQAFAGEVPQDSGGQRSSRGVSG
jgi:uncharacterized protein